MTNIRARFLAIATAVTAVLNTAALSFGAEPSVVGNWKLVSFFTEELARKKTALLGEHPKGYLIYTPQGRMMALVVHETRSPPKTDEDRINLHKNMYAYSGRYTIEGDKITHHVDISWDEAWTGSDQVRYFKLEGDILTIKTGPSTNAITGKESVSTLVWERER
jgi:hypothetical protein